MISDIKIPIEFSPRLDLFALLILLGIFQGFFLVYFFLNRTNRKIQSNVFVGLFLLVLSLNISEVFLNYTGFILKIVWINDFSEPLNFVIGPLCYFYVKTSTGSKFNRKELIHFLPFFLYLVYFQLYFFQPWQAKYNSYVWAYRPDLKYISVDRPFNSDPFHIRVYINELTFIQLIAYTFAALKVIRCEFTKAGKKFWQKVTEPLVELRLLIINNFIIISIFVFVKVFIGRDLGDNYIASYVAFIIYMISFNIAKRSLYFKPASNEITEETPLKYQKSSLSNEYKKNILDKIVTLFETEKYYLNSLVSLPGLAKKIGESQHHVSQVINELLNLSFFEMIAQYRIDEAKRLLKDTKYQNLTIDDISDRVGYNSKSAFNKAFKKHTGFTPGQFRENIENTKQ